MSKQQKKRHHNTELELYGGPMDGMKMNLELPDGTTDISIRYGEKDSISIYRLTGDRWEYVPTEGKHP